MDDKTHITLQCDGTTITVPKDVIKSFIEQYDHTNSKKDEPKIVHSKNTFDEIIVYDCLEYKQEPTTYSFQIYLENANGKKIWFDISIIVKQIDKYGLVSYSSIYIDGTVLLGGTFQMYK